MTEDARLRALAFADRLASRCSDALGDALVSVILHGSLALNDFTADSSDIDLLVVVKNPLSDNQLASLRDLVHHRRKDAPRRLDLRVVTRATAGFPTRNPSMEAAFVLRPGKDSEMVTRVTEEPDLVVELSMARAHGRSILGRAPDAVIGPVPGEWLVEIGDRQLAAWESLTDDANHAVFSLVRAGFRGVHNAGRHPQNPVVFERPVTIRGPTADQNRPRATRAIVTSMGAVVDPDGAGPRLLFQRSPRGQCS